MKTLFDGILDGSVPCEVFFEDEGVLAFFDIKPQAPKHVLVIPKQRYTSFADFADADPSSVGSYITKVAQIAKRLDSEDEGFRIVFNHGKNGQQTVNYVHAHILCGRSLTWPPG